ncbi:MAG: hypothetical protein RID53_01825 [Coleofasciculus sp. B1-GNL1-01]|uniref:hypothetical protein n=1 Tax=Coleofasciculus sp. B1-GNL1-01 TaxID=3068484 RepID=UPI003300EC5B
MSSTNQPSETNPSEQLSQPEVDQQVRQAKTQARKEEVLEIYEDLLGTIWHRILPTLGRVTVIAIMDRALAITQDDYPLIEHLHTTAQGIDFEPLRQRLGEEERLLLRDALKELIANLIDILAMLTGDILVRQLLRDIEERKLL